MQLIKQLQLAWAFLLLTKATVVHVHRIRVMNPSLRDHFHGVTVISPFLERAASV